MCDLAHWTWFKKILLHSWSHKRCVGSSTVVMETAFTRRLVTWHITCSQHPQRKAKPGSGLPQPGVMPGRESHFRMNFSEKTWNLSISGFCSPSSKRISSQKQKYPSKCTSPPPHTYHLIVHIKGNYILQVSESSVKLILHIYCTLLRERGGEESFVVHICSGYCLCRSDWMKEQWVSFQFLMSTSNYLFNFMPGEALYSYTQNHFTSFVMLCFRGDWLAFQLTALITTWIWLHCRGINIMQQSS